MRHRLFFLCFLVIAAARIAAPFFFQEPAQSPEELYRKIRDLRHPTQRDYQQIQTYLEKGPRPLLSHMQDFKHAAKRFKLIDAPPQSGVVHVHCGAEDRRNCILLYASYNRNYAQALKRLVEQIQNSDYEGHILYRIGGWPNAEGGDLTLAHVPYAFKVCFFREAERLGYHNALWLDTSIVPLTSLAPFFSQLQKQGYLACANTHPVGLFFNELAAQSFGITLAETHHIPSCSAGIFGLNLKHPLGKQALTLWHEKAKDPTAFYSARPEQNALSLILFQLGMTHWIDYDRLAESPNDITPASFFLLDRPFARQAKDQKARHGQEMDKSCRLISSSI